VLMAAGHAAEAIAPLRGNYETWAALQKDSPHTGEALFWLGRASTAAGDPHGLALVAEAREALAHSPLESHRRLASATAAL